MPPANQGSKGALITWTVVATVFGIMCAVLALIAYAGQTNAEEARDVLQDRYQDVVTDTDLQGGQVAELRAERDQRGSGQKLLQYAINRGALLAEKTTGTTEVAAASDQIDATIQSINSTLGATSSATNLQAAASNALAAYRNSQEQIQSLEQNINELRQQHQNQLTTLEGQMQALQNEVAAAQEARQQALAEAASASEGVESLVSTTGREMDDLAAAFAQQLRQLEDQLQEVRGTNTGLRNALNQATSLLTARIGGEQLVTQPDGTVIRSPSENRLTIDLGRRNSIARGMTFQLYDSVRGIPAVTGDPDSPESQQLPQGKAAIEVVRVSETSSEARIINQQPGTTIREGDVIANLAYDRNTPIRFRIYGEFDLENNGDPSVRDRERLESLVREFGGEVVPGVTVDTDVVVLGKQPELPDFTEEELQNPVNQQILFEARRQLREYEDVVRQARELNKNIVNQNQLLYYIGYFEQAGR